MLRLPASELNIKRWNYPLWKLYLIICVCREWWLWCRSRAIMRSGEWCLHFRWDLLLWHLTSDMCLLKVGDLVNVTCYSRGSSPPAQLQWSVNGERVSKAELLMDILSVHTEDSVQFTFSTFRSSLTHAALQQIYFNGHFRRREGQIGRVHKDFETIFYSQILWSNHLGSSWSHPGVTLEYPKVVEDLTLTQDE